MQVFRYWLIDFLHEEINFNIYPQLIPLAHTLVIDENVPWSETEFDVRDYVVEHWPTLIRVYDELYEKFQEDGDDGEYDYVPSSSSSSSN